MSVQTADREIRIEDMPGLGASEAMELARGQMDALIKQLKELDPQDWEKPTDCDRWAVRDIVAHVVGWAEALPSPKEMMRLSKGTRAVRKELGAKLDAQNEAQVIARRHMSPEQLIAAFETAGDRFLRMRRIGGLVGKPLPFYNPAVGLTTLGFLMSSIFTRDHFMHRIDIARATGRELELGESEKRVVDDVVRHWGRSSKADALLRLTGPVGGNFVCGSGGRADIKGDALEFCRVLAGRAEPEAMEIEGDRLAATRWLAAHVPF
ncbi:MAG: maleylpyruvate isomerase family mycothiol-dependent enzyme [Actinomycetota bacterium]|nr:maleylpyruvate isomerase family mycothiol-dependent enzyme [Actinomycetota bacterium]